MALHVAAKSEPKSVAKGQFQCEISGTGLTLKQGKKEITVPCGVPAEYGGKNKIEIAMPDYRLELSVGKLGSYQNRLAKDITTFLQNRGPAPELSDYLLPWYFSALSALPIGIPIITAGGAIPGGIGFGLAAACYGVAQKEEWSTQIRLMVIVGIVGMGYCALFAFLVFALGRA